MTAVLDAMPNWDPAAVLAAEVEAHSLLYSGLNAEQRSGDDLLCEEGVGTTSDLHWRYLLANESRLLFLQCPSCLHRWWHDTEFGVVDNWPDPPDFPTSPGQAA